MVGDWTRVKMTLGIGSERFGGASSLIEDEGIDSEERDSWYSRYWIPAYDTPNRRAKNKIRRGIGALYSLDQTS